MFLAFSSSGGLDDNRLRAIAKIVHQFAPPAFNTPPDIWKSRVHPVCFMHWTRAGEEGEERLAQNRKGTLVLDGYITEGERSQPAKTALSLVSEDGSFFSLRGSTGGVASFAWLSAEGQFYAWSTQPASLGLYYSSGDGFSVIGTRPLLVHLAARENEYPNLTAEDIDVRLTSGSLLTGVTFFRGVRRVGVRRAVVLEREYVREIDHPLPDDHVVIRDETSAEEEISEALLSAVKPFAAKRSLVLMSGGKDSRTVTAACVAAGANFSGLTFGPEGGAETVVAQGMARAVNVICAVEQQDTYADIIEGAARSHMRCEGLFTSVPHQINFAALSPRGVPILHGHGHLLRGGFASSIEPDIARVMKATYAPFIQGWVTAEAAGKVRAYLDKWIATRRNSPDESHLPYWSHLDLRLGVHLAPSILDYDGINRMIYPLLDERLVIASNKIPLAYKAAERTVFGAIRSLAPALAALPLYGENWRFEAKGEDPRFPGRAQRVTELDKNKVPGGTTNGLRYLGRKPQGYDGLTTAASTALDSALYKTIRGLLSEQMKRIMESYAAGKGIPSDMLVGNYPAQGSARRKMLEIFGLCVLFEGQWLRPYRPAPSDDRLVIQTV